MRPRNPANLFTATPIAAALAAITLATPLWTGSAQSAPATTATRLLPQALPGTSYAGAAAISSQGAIVGWSETAAGQIHAVRWILPSATLTALGN